jgi:hypothetical protein
LIVDALNSFFFWNKVLAIDGQNTETMTTDAITKYLMNNIDSEREFKVCTPMNNLRTVVAPSGKLGIVINKNAVVQTIKDTSPLQGKLFVGDKVNKF